MLASIDVRRVSSVRDSCVNIRSESFIFSTSICSAAGATAAQGRQGRRGGSNEGIYAGMSVRYSVRRGIL
jgi:hypothetical protein